MSQSSSPQPQKPSRNNGETLALQSSYLQEAVYDATSFTLTLSFKEGQEISYWPIYQQTWDAFKQSPSKGSFYVRNIKGKVQALQRQGILKDNKGRKRTS